MKAKSKKDAGAARTNGRLENLLFSAADKLRKNIDAAEYKHIVLGLIFLKYISDSFEVMHQKLTSGEGEYEVSV
jgi:type I restriction enzyme M protein